MSYSVTATRRRLALSLLALPLAVGLAWLLPFGDGFLSPRAPYLLPGWVAVGHLMTGLSQALVGRSWRRGWALVRGSLVVYSARHGSLVHLLAAALGALAEEMVFRYALLLGLVALIGSAPLAVAVSSAVFALAHVRVLRRGRPASKLADLLTFGLVLAIVTWATGTIWPAVAIHATRNYILRCLLVSRQEWLALHGPSSS